MIKPKVKTRPGRRELYGGFEFPEVGPGSWRINAELKRHSLELRGHTLVMVSHHDEDDVQLRLAAPFTVEGSVDPDGTYRNVDLAPVDGPQKNSASGKVDRISRVAQHLKARFSSVYGVCGI